MRRWFSVIVAFSVEAGSVGHAAEAPLPVIYDTDIGADIDDTWVLGFILASPELDLKLAVSDSHNALSKAAIIAKFLDQAGRGHTLADPKSMLGHVALTWKDQAAFHKLLAERIARDRP